MSTQTGTDADRSGGFPLVEGYPLGPFETNCYVVAEHGGRCWIVDAGFDPQPLIARVRERGLQPEAVVLTHAHADHIAGLPDVRRAFPDLPVWIHEAESGWLGDPEANRSASMGYPISLPDPDRTFTEGDVLTLGEQQWRVLHTPGHTPGSVSLYNEEASVVLAGDALFAGSIGRTDFPGSSFDTLAEAIRTRLYTLPDDTRVLPGHGPETSIGREKRSNPFVPG